ncbi:MAG: type II toxin-antitoxin system Phd/YefM family antitoxin [Deltaproteobacteria bacterium]|nr:type II toxin-antitoxin system Phd/YefM family antitoxin [Deltaproteobacteria bacterium]
MRFVSIRDIRNTPATVWEALGTDDLVLTSNGDPVALIVRVEKDSLDETVSMLRRARAQQALAAIRAGARREGTSALTSAEIDAEISAARAERKHA